MPLSEPVLQLFRDWRIYANRTESDALVFSTRSGSPLQPNNVLRRQIGLRRATWLTFRRTYSSWSHDKGIPGKVIAQLMGHADVDTTLNIYTQVMDGSLREAANKIGAELFTIVHSSPGDDSLSR